MDILEEARKFRAFIETMAESVDDETAKEHIDVFPNWKVNFNYKKDFRVRYNEVLYKVLQDHVSQEDWTPDVAVSLFVRIDDPSIEWPEWVQPAGAHDAYPINSKVSHGEFETHEKKHWLSLIDANVYEPTEEVPTIWSLQNAPEPEPEPEIPEWTEGVIYNTGDRVMFNNEVYESLIDNNVWSPEAYPAGWAKV